MNVPVKILCVLYAVLSLTSCQNKKQIEGKPFPEEKLYVINQFDSQPFLGETYINDYDYAMASKFVTDTYVRPAGSGACSSFRVGEYAARNLDWFIRDYAMLIVHTAANAEKHRYASVAIVSSNGATNRAMISSGVVSDHIEIDGVSVDNWRNIFPILTTDGINSEGVCVNTNIVVHENAVRQGYVPCTGDKAGKEITSFIALPRYILDNCSSCDDAIEKCADLNVSQASVGPLSTEDSHIFVSDKNKTVVLEWYNNKMVYTEFPRSNNFKSKNGMPAIMTNFYNCIGNQHVDSEGKINLETMLPVHPYAMGVERYETIRAGLDKVNSVESAANLIEKVMYSNYYNINNKWYTENGMSCVLNDDVWYYPTSSGSFAPASTINEAVKKTFEPGGNQEKLCAEYVSIDEQMKRLDNGIEAENWWYTEFTDVFDINNKTLYVMPQEGWYKHEYYDFTVLGD